MREKKLQDGNDLMKAIHNNINMRKRLIWNSDNNIMTGSMLNIYIYREWEI